MHPRSIATPRRRTLSVSMALVAMLSSVTIGPVEAQAPTPPPPPTISSIKPAVVGPGKNIRIKGRNFIDVRAVTMAGVSLKHRVVDRRNIVAKAPPSAARGPVMVVTRGGAIAGPRVVVVQPSISAEPRSGPPASTIIVTGSGFVPGEPVDLFFGRAPIASASANRAGLIELPLMVPPATAPGPTFVRAQGRFSGVPRDVSFEVATDWAQRGSTADGNRRMASEARLGVTSAPSLSLDWVADVLSRSTSSPAVVGGTVVVGAATGAVLSIPADCAADGEGCTALALGITGGAVASSPAVSDGIVYVGSRDGGVYAFDLDCAVAQGPCEPLWSYMTGGPVASSPAFDDEVVVVGSEDGTVYAFDRACMASAGDDGSGCTPRWVAETGSSIESSPAIHDGTVYVGSNDGYLHAFGTDCAQDGGSCEPRWRGWTGGAVRSSPAIADGVVYVGSADGKVHGFAVGCATAGETCLAIWRGVADGPVDSSPVVADGRVVVGTNTGSVMAFSVACDDRTAGCAPLWTARAGGPVRSSPAVTGAAQGGPMVFVGSDDGFLYGYPLNCRPTGNPATCAATWASGTPGPISASPAIADGAVYVASEDGTVRRWSIR